MLKNKNLWMNNDEYLQSVIRSHYVTPISLNDSRLYSLTFLLKFWAGDNLNQLKLSGSSAKDLVVSGNADIDIFVSLKSSTSTTLKDLYASLEAMLKSKGYSTERHTVAIQTKVGSLKVDIVPGKIQQGYKNYHSLYNNYSDTWLQTNIDEHINRIKSCGRINEIRALKIWSKINFLKFPSIYLELVVIDALYNRKTNQLANNLKTIFEYLERDFMNKQIADPSNTNNIISNYSLKKYQKEEIAKAASVSLSKIYWNDVIW